MPALKSDRPVAYAVFYWFRANPKARETMGMTMNPLDAVKAAAHARSKGYDAEIVGRALTAA